MRRFWLGVVLLCLTATVVCSDVRRRFIATGPPPSTFPQVRATSTTTWTTAGTSVTLDLPAGIVSGELLICTGNIDARHAATWPVGWTELQDRTASLGDFRMVTAYRIADGTEGATVTYTLAGTATAATGSCYAINNWHGTTPPESERSCGAVQPNPPILIVSWGNVDTMWISIGGGDSAGALNSFSTGYDDNQLTVTAAQTHGKSSAEITGDTEDPGIMNITGVLNSCAFTVGVRPQ